MLENKLKLIVGQNNCPEKVFEDIKELYSLSICQSTEPTTIGLYENHIMRTYGLTQENIEHNLDNFSKWFKNQPKPQQFSNNQINNSSNFYKEFCEKGLDCYFL